MFLLRARLRKECQLLDIMTPKGERILNEILAEDGHTLRILVQKEQMAKGSIKHAFREEEDDVVVPDSFYVFVLYERTEGCPIIAGSSIVGPLRDRDFNGVKVKLKSNPEGSLGPEDVEIRVPEPARKGAKKPASKNDVPGKRKGAGKVNAHGVDLDGVPDFMLNIAGDADNITAVKRDRNGVKGVSVGPRPKPQPEPAPPPAKKKEATKPPAAKAKGKPASKGISKPKPKG